MEIIARLGRLTALNGSPVAPAERTDAERYYVSLYAGAWRAARAAGDAALRAFRAMHPRFERLAAGAP